MLTQETTWVIGYSTIILKTLTRFRYRLYKENSFEHEAWVVLAGSLGGRTPAPMMYTYDVI